MNDFSSILLVDKPSDWTSFDVVAKIRGQLKAAYRHKSIQPTKRQVKVGHAGTLDPFATGLLIILLGDSTKQADTFLKLDKTYQATIRLGETSTTGDSEGQLAKHEVGQSPSEGDVRAALSQFVGQITQTPPAYSAIKINGQRAYKLARKGEAVDMPSRQVKIYSIELDGYSYPDIKITVKVSSGTYIRSLAESIGQALGTGAYCQQLRRTEIGQYSLNDAIRPDQALDNIAIA